VEDKQYITFIISVLVGCELLLWRNRFAATVVKEQNRMWGFHFGEREERISVIVAIIVGFGFLGVGILGLLGFIHWKP